MILIPPVSDARRFRATKFRRFCEIYFGHYFSRPFEKFHEALFSIGESALYHPGRFHNMIAAKETGKSLILAEILPIAMLCLERHKYIAVQSNVNGIQDRANNIVRELTTNQKLLTDFGHKIAPKRDIKNQWEDFNDQALTLHNDSRILFLGPKISIRGSRHGQYRPSFVAFDDMHTALDYDSPLKLEAQKKVVMETVSSLDMRRSNAVCLSNVAQEDSIQGYLSTLSGWRTHVWPIVNEDTGERIWYSQAELDEKRAVVGEYVWTRDYLCQDFDGTRRVFDWDEFDKFERSAIQFDQAGNIVRIGSDLIEKVAIRFDPARGFDKTKPKKDQTGDPDRSALVCGARGRSGRVYIVAADLVIDSPRITEDLSTRSIDAAVRMVAAFRPQRFAYENNGFQELLGPRLADAVRPFGIVPHGEATTGVRKETRIVSTEAEIMGRNRSVSFCDDLPAEYRGEWRRFTIDGTKGHDDGMDATERLIKCDLRQARGGISFGAESYFEAA